MFMPDDDEDFGGLYENGHWEWNIKNELIFVSDLPIKEDYGIEAPIKIIGPIEFKDDIDLIEQQKFRKRYQRKTDDSDVVTLQDVKDIVLFTAPLTILNKTVINVLHLPMTERFLRALIFCCQYYLQVSNIMTQRRLQLETKIRTTNSELTEEEYRENLEDLRLLVTKEYSTMILGGDEFRKFHHMGPEKKSRSLSKKDAILFETFIRISIQIVWLALGRIGFNQIELEVHRMFKSDTFNVVEHKLRTNYIAKMSPEEKNVLFGHCVRNDSKLNILSPLLNEETCSRSIDFRMLGIGINKQSLSSRLRYFECALVMPEIEFHKIGLTIGIIGLPRNMFDTMLKELPVATGGGSTASSASRASTSRTSRASKGTMHKEPTIVAIIKLYPDLVLPDKEEGPDYLPDEFPMESLPRQYYSQIHKRKWYNRIPNKRLSLMSKKKEKQRT